MFGSRSARTTKKLLTQLIKSHGRVLEPGETFVSVCDCFAPDEPHPDETARGLLSLDEQLSLEGAAHLRLSAVRSALGMEDEEFTELPISPSGYVVAHTQKRLFIFEGDGKTYLTEADITNLWLQPIEHAQGMFTLVFKDETERVAVATRRESLALTKHFIESFPDRRGQARILLVAGQPAIAEF